MTVEVETPSGRLAGREQDGVRRFLGIPFAEPPVGARRFAAPEPVRPWTGVRDAGAFAASAPQSAMILPLPGMDVGRTDEDCLYLNVFAPAGGAAGKPVLVWIHGGAFVIGSGSQSVYDGSQLARRGDVVVVTINYRLGALGFLHLADLCPDLPGAVSNPGMRDQVAALEWVRSHIEAFGGDPRNVTVFGESGGAFDVCAHVTSPLSRGLFQKAIAQSGGCSTTWGANGVIHDKPAGAPWITKSAAESDAVAISARLGCPDIACLRALPPTAFTAIDRGVTPVVTGNRVLPVNPVEALKSGRFNRVPVIWGNTRDEGRLTSATVPEPFDYQGLLEQGFGVEKAAKIAAEYPLSAYGNARLAYGAVLTDGVWACNQLADDRLLARHTPTYGYEFADRTAPMGWFKGSFSADFPAGAAHSFELAYFFDVPTFDLDPAQQRLAATMIRDWTTFARTGKPGWSRYSGGDVQEYSLGPIGQINGLTRHNCSFWNSIG